MTLAPTFEEIRKALEQYEGMDPLWPCLPEVDWAAWCRILLDGLDECKRQQGAGHDAVNDAARRWREIGYESGYSDGYGDAMEEMTKGTSS